MPVLKSKLDTSSDEYQQNLRAMQALWDDVAAELAKVPSIGGQRYVDRHRARGKMLVRERIELLVDPGTPFLELSPLAGWGTDDAVGVGVAMGIGVIEGVECAIFGTDMTYKGGSVNPTTLTKLERLFEIAEANRLPMVALNESAGADLPRDAALRRLVELQYERNDVDFHRGTFRVRGDVVEVFPVYEADTAVRLEWWGDTV